MFKNLFHFTVRLFREVSLLLFLLADVIGLILLYWKNIDIPVSVLTVIPIVGLYVASFNIYRKGSADIRISFSDISMTAFKKYSRESFVGIISGNVANYGLQTGILQDFNVQLISINDVDDPFVRNKIGIGVSISPLLPPKNFPSWSPGSSSHEGQTLPLVLEPGKTVPLCVNMYLYFSCSQPEMEEAVEWLESVSIRVTYSVTQSDGHRKESNSFLILTNSLKSILDGETNT